jgi:hypothetical protein
MVGEREVKMATRGPRQPQRARQARKEWKKTKTNDVRTTELEMWIWFVNVYVEKNVFAPIICIATIGVNIMKHKLHNNKYDASIIKLNVYIEMILANKLIHIKINVNN